MTTPVRMPREWSGIPYSDLVGRLCAILLTSLTLLHQITTSSTPWTIIFVKNPSPMKQTCGFEFTNFFASKTFAFYRKWIAQLETRWQMVLDADGAYFED